jgi:glycosyltransferase involved in cell wall biosynthesis
MSLRISVITATLNRRAMLLRAIASVVSQAAVDVEHIVVDGGSTDSTLEALAGFPHLRVLTGPDHSVYDAWNRALTAATGDIVCLLNSDDEIPRGAFAHIRDAFMQTDCDMVTGAVELRFPNGAGSSSRLIDSTAILRLDPQNIGPGIPIINARYMRRTMMLRAGPFETRFGVVGDRPFLFRVFDAQPRQVIIREPVYRYHAHEGSLTLWPGKGADARAEESFRAAGVCLGEARTKGERRLIADWLAWSAAYLAARQMRAGRTPEAFQTLGRATRADPLWPLRLPLQLVRHAAARPDRRGSPLMDAAPAAPETAS